MKCLQFIKERTNSLCEEVIVAQQRAVPAGYYGFLLVQRWLHSYFPSHIVCALAGKHTDVPVGQTPRTLEGPHMPRLSLSGAALTATLLAASPAWGQAGRYPLPLPRVPGGGSSFHFPYHLLRHLIGDSADEIIAAVVILLLLMFLGCCIGYALGRAVHPTPGNADPQTPTRAWPPGGPADLPPTDPIRSPEEVAGRAAQATQFLETLSRVDARFDPHRLRDFVIETFTRVQQCWQERDYRPVTDVLSPDLRVRHEVLLRAMRRNGEVNRIDDLRVYRLDFVHICWPAVTKPVEVTALITFEAKAYFVCERTGAFRRGSQKVIPYQEFWTFRHDGTGWRLQTIDQSSASHPLEAPNRVAGLTGDDQGIGADGAAE